MLWPCADAILLLMAFSWRCVSQKINKHPVKEAYFKCLESKETRLVGYVTMFMSMMHPPTYPTYLRVCYLDLHVAWIAGWYLHCWYPILRERERGRSNMIYIHIYTHAHSMYPSIDPSIHLPVCVCILYTYTYIPYLTLHYLTLHYLTLHYLTLHYITLHYITLP